MSYSPVLQTCSLLLHVLGPFPDWVAWLFYTYHMASLCLLNATLTSLSLTRIFLVTKVGSNGFQSATRTDWRSDIRCLTQRWEVIAQ